jgi:predicted DNA-binding protein (MmcQ/YjbR family)
MNVERMRAYMMTLPHAVETMQWGENLVFWVGDKALGGKMFALVPLDAVGSAVISYSAGPERYAELIEREGIVPAPYMARIHWVAVERWEAFRMQEWEREVAAAHAITFGKLPARTRAVLALPEKEQKKLLKERRKVLAERAKAKGK